MHVTFGEWIEGVQKLQLIWILLWTHYLSRVLQLWFFLTLLNNFHEMLQVYRKQKWCNSMYIVTLLEHKLWKKGPNVSFIFALHKHMSYEDGHTFTFVIYSTQKFSKLFTWHLVWKHNAIGKIKEPMICAYCNHVNCVLGLLNPKIHVLHQGKIIDVYNPL